MAYRFVAGTSSEGDATVLVVLGSLAAGGLLAEPLEQARLRRLIRRNTDDAPAEGAA